jgi:hypothetical protein
MFWRHPFWKDVSARTVAAIVAAGILAGLAMLWAPVRNLIFNTPSALWAFIGWLGDEVAISRWRYCVLVLALLVSVIYWLRALFSLYFSAPYMRYTEDIFDTILWKWKWARRGSAKEGEPYQIKPYCENCDVRLSYRTVIHSEDGASRWSTRPLYKCSACHRQFLHVSPDEVKDDIMRIKQERWPGSR